MVQSTLMRTMSPACTHGRFKPFAWCARIFSVSVIGCVCAVAIRGNKLSARQCEVNERSASGSPILEYEPVDRAPRDLHEEVRAGKRDRDRRISERQLIENAAIIRIAKQHPVRKAERDEPPIR